MANTGNTQQQINYGAAANDGQGDPLRTAFIKTDDNFDAIWNTGPVGSNITILNNTVQSNNTNGNIVLRPNGVGVIQANAAILPNATDLRDLGSANQRFRSAYIGTGGLSVDGNIAADYVAVSTDLTVNGNLTVEGDVIQIGNLVTDALTIQLANTATTDAQANGSGITVGANDDVATLLYNSTDNEWRSNIGANVAGNITANYFIGNGSQLTGITSYSNANVVSLLANFGSNTISTTGNVAGNFVAPGGDGQVLYNRNGVIGASPSNFNFDESSLTLFLKTASISGNVNDGRDAVYAGVPGVTPLGSDVILQAYGNAAAYSQINMENISDSPEASGDFIITADNGTDDTHFLNLGMASSTWNGTQPNSLGANVGPNDGYLYTQDGNLIVGVKSGISDMYLWRFTDQGITGTGNIIPSANAVYSLGNATNYWSNLWVASNTIFIGGVALGVTGNVLTVAGEPVLSNDSDSSITTTGNIAAGNILTDNYLYANGEPFVSASTGNITFTDTTMSPPDGVDITISAANSEVVIEAFDIRLDATDDLRLTGNDIVSLRNRSTTDPITIRTDYDNNDYVWEFAVNGTLTTPGDIITAGDVTGTAGASTLYFKAQPASNTYIQLNNSVDSVISTVANLEVRTDADGSAKQWLFDTTGNLTAPGNITATNFIGSIAAANVTGLANVATTGAYADLTGTPTIPSLGDFTITNNTIQTDNGVGGITLSIFGPDAADPPAFISRDWIFANTGAFTSPGAISATGNITASANIVSGNGAHVVLGNAASQLQQNGSNAYVSLSGSVFLVPDTSASGLNGVVIGGSGYLLAPNSSRNAVLNYGGSSGTMGIYRVNIYGNQATAIENGGSNGVGNIGANTTNRFNTAFLTQVDASGNISAGNITTTGRVSASGNILGLNFGTEGSVQASSVEATGNISGGNLSVTGNITGNTAGFAIGYRDIPQVAFTGNATMAATDAGKHFYSTESTDYILTIADNSAVSWPVGTAITVVNRGTGNITVAQASGVSLYLAGNSSAGNRTVTTYGMATVLNVAANVWMINGTGVA